MEYKIIWTREDIADELNRINEAGKINSNKKANKKKTYKKFSYARNYRGKDGYREYLKTDWWIKRRAKFWENHIRVCYCCGKYADNLHHNNYSRIGEELDKDLVPLCHDCHEKVHNIQKSSGKLKNNHKELRKIIRNF